MHTTKANGGFRLFPAISILVLLTLIAALPALAGPLDNWHSRDSKTTSDLYHVAWGGNRFVTVGRAGSILTSPDGAVWTATSVSENILYGVSYGSSTFVVSGGAGTILVSRDGTSWSRRTSGKSSELYSVAFGANRFVVVGNSGTILISDDRGDSWTEADSGVDIGLFGVTYGNGQFVAVGESGTVLTSPDGMNWTTRRSGKTVWFDQVTYGNEFVSAGQAGTIITSSDGVDWISRPSGTESDFYCVGYGNGTYIAVGANGNIFTSSDGASWARRESHASVYLRGVAFGSSTFVVTGFSGTILQSDPVSGSPVADAGPDQTVATGTNITLDGNGSYDPDGGILTYAWQLAVRPSGSAAALSNPALPNPTFIADVRGEYRISLVVTDSAGLQSQADEVVVTAGNRPVSNAGQDRSFVKVGNPLALDGRASSSPDGLPITYEWQITSKPSNSKPLLANPASSTPTFTPDMRGVYRISLVVTDLLELKSQPSYVTITAGSQPIANAGGDQSVKLGAQVILDGSASSSPDQAYPLSYSWQFEYRPGGSTAVLANLTTVHPVFTADSAGPYTISLVVTDPAGFESTPSQVTVTATDPNAPAGLPSVPSGDGGGGGGGGCFIATSLYGSAAAPEVIALKRFRDTYLLTNPLGRYFVTVYYRFSPGVASAFERHDTLKGLGRGILTPLVWTLTHPLASASFLLALLALITVALLLKIK